MAAPKTCKPVPFFLKFFLFLNVYANLFLAGSVLAGLGIRLVLGLLGGGPLALVLCLALGLAAAFGLFEYGLITSTAAAKWKYYRVNFKRLRKNGYHAEYFLDEMYEPCMRLLIRDLLRTCGLAAEWPGLRRTWRGSGAASFEDMMKKRILASLDKGD
jgi:hypothetical protein